MDDDTPRVPRPDWPQGDVSYLDKVRKLIDTLREIASEDYEVAHALEDDLYRDVLTHIARTGEPKSATLAMTALETQSIVFPRYTA